MSDVNISRKSELSVIVFPKGAVLFKIYSENSSGISEIVFILLDLVDKQK